VPAVKLLLGFVLLLGGLGLQIGAMYRMSRLDLLERCLFAVFAAVLMICGLVVLGSRP
jgi:hypothetical protein